MTYVFAILFVLALGFLIFLTLKNNRLEGDAIRAQEVAQKSVAEAQKFVDQRIAETLRESQASVAKAQKLIDQQVDQMHQESERIRQHYEDESRKISEAAGALVTKIVNDLEPLRKYEKLKNAEEEAQRQLSVALNEAASLRAEARGFLDKARAAADDERAAAIQRSKEIREQAEASLSQATRDAGRIFLEAEKRAEKIGGDAYVALRDKQTLEQAVQALWNVTEGYGDRYVAPSHSLVDDLAANFGYTEAGQALRAAREQSRRMVEQRQAASCNYVEEDRRDRANRFVTDAFNGRVDAILTRTKHDNYGTLEQEIRDAYSLVNLNGLAFRDARILPAYLDSRMAELRWAVVVHDLAQKQREEQRFLKERMRDEQKAEQERQAKLREAAKEKEQAAKEEELKRKALEEAETRLAQAHAEDRARLQQEVEKMRQEVADANQRVVDATKRELTAAQLGKKGHVYIISNLGSFGEGVFKIGQTRRLDPQERVDELGDASVPFEFDIHGLIESENAPALEHKIHKRFLPMQVNKMNPRKEFFRVSLTDIHQEIEKLKQDEDFTVKVWTDKATAVQYKESLDIEGDPQKKEKWIVRQKALADRKIKIDASRFSSSDKIEPDDENQES